MFMWEELVELGEENLGDEEKKARNFRAKLLGLIYEDLLKVWFKNKCYEVLRKDVRKGKYGKKKAAVDFILKKGCNLYAVEAKCWPAYLNGKLKKITLNNIEQIKKEFKTPFLEKDFVKKYTFKENGINGKILVWWDVEESEVEQIKRDLNLSELISIKKVLNDLKKEPNKEIKEIVGKYKKRADELFDALLNG